MMKKKYHTITMSTLHPLINRIFTQLPLKKAQLIINIQAHGRLINLIIIIKQAQKMLMIKQRPILTLVTIIN